MLILVGYVCVSQAPPPPHPLTFPNTNAVGIEWTVSSKAKAAPNQEMNGLEARPLFPVVPEDMESSVWRTTRQFPVWNNQTLPQYGRKAWTGSYSYMDGLACTETKACQIHFPYVDLKTIIPLDRDEHNILPNAQDDTQYPPAIYIPQLMSSSSSSSLTTPRVSYQNFALLTRAGAKEDFDEGMNANQDRVLLLSPFSVEDETVSEPSSGTEGWLMGLFDGHGTYGHVVSHVCASHVARIVAEQVQQEQQQQHAPAPGTRLNMSKILTNTFLELDRAVDFADLEGATGIVMWRWKDQIAVANTGDSHASILRYNPTDNSLDILYATQPHKPDTPEERARIEQHGGTILPAPLEGGSSRVVVPFGPVVAALAMSRSIGDHAARDVGVIPNPTVQVFNLPQLLANQSQDSRLFAIAATDGLLDFVEYEHVLRHVAHSLFPQSRGTAVDGTVPTLLEACEQLILRASQRWAKEGSYRDDISIAVTTFS